MRRVVLVAVVGGLILLTGGGVRAQQSVPTKGGAPGLSSQPGSAADDDNVVPDVAVRAHMDQERMRAMNDDRHKRLQDDVDKLLALTNELKTDVNKSNKDELSLDVIKKAQEIEKLAHDVQNRMKN